MKRPYSFNNNTEDEKNYLEFIDRMITFNSGLDRGEIYLKYMKDFDIKM